MNILTGFLAALAFLFAFLFFDLRKRSGLLASETKKAADLASKREHLLQTAAEEKNRLFAILESMTEGVLVVDTSKKVLLINGALEKYFGFRREVVEGSYFWENFRDADINQMFEKALQDGVAVRKEHSASLSTSVYEIQISPVHSGGEFLGVVGVFRDVTLLKEFERLRSEFVANVSHELKTPLTSILGFVETLKEGGVEDPENRMKFLQIIETQSKKLHVLIEDLLLLSKFESAQEPLRLEEVDLERLFEKMQDTFLPLLKEKKVRFQVIAAPKAIQVQAEPSSLERALSNLIDNALKYNRPDGRVTLQASKADGHVILEVRDTGIGVSEKELPRLFERFYRVDKSRSRESGGTGLGLSIAKHIIERHGVKITVQSTPGQGSTFSIVLPA